MEPVLGQWQRRSSSLMTFDDTKWLLHFASCLSVCSDFPNLLRTYAVFFLEKALQFTCDRWKGPCSVAVAAQISSSMSFSSVHYNNHGRVTSNRRRSVDFSWISTFFWKVRGLYRERFTCPMWSCFQKCLFRVRGGIGNLVPSQEPLWRARRGAPEGDERPDQTSPEEHLQREKHQQLHLVAGGGGPRGTKQKWVK